MQALVGAFGVRLQHGAWPGTVNHAGNARFGIQPCIGVERGANGFNGLAKHGAGLLLHYGGQRFALGCGLHGAGQQQAPHLDRDAGCALRGSRVGYHAANVGFDAFGVFFRNHAAVKFETDFARHHVGVGAACNLAHVQIRVAYARHAGGDLL